MNRRNHTMNSSNVIELDVMDLFWRLLTQWKAILLFSIIVGTTLLLFSYRTNLRKYENVIEEESRKEKRDLRSSDEKFLTDEYGEKAVDILEAIDDTDRYVVLNVLRQEKIAKKQRDYFSDSLYMNLDSDHLRCLSMGYMISCKNGKDDRYVNILIKEYQNLYQDETLLQAINNEIGIDIDYRYVKELITVDSDVTIGSGDKAGIDSFYINIWIPESVKEVSGIQEEIAKRVDSYQKDLSNSISEHNTKLIQVKDYYTSDPNILVDQTDMLNRINSMAYNVKTNRDGLQGEQKTAYDLIINQDENSSNSDLGLSQQEISERSVPKYNIKYGIIGFAIGTVLYLIIYLCWIVFKGIYYSSNTLQTLTKSCLLGCIHFSSKGRHNNLLTSSSIVEKIRYRSRKDLVLQTNELISEVAAVCRYNEISQIAIMECGSIDEMAKNNLSLIDKELSSRGIESLNLIDNELEKMENVKISNIVLAVQKDRTIIKEIRKARKQADFLNINIFGVIYYD